MDNFVYFWNGKIVIRLQFAIWWQINLQTTVSFGYPILKVDIAIFHLSHFPIISLIQSKAFAIRKTMAKIDQCVTIVAARRRCWRRELSSTAILGRELARVGEQLG